MENKARVISEYKGAYKVKNDNGEFLARVTGKHIFNATSREDYPAVGDWVMIDELGEKQAVIKSILPRRTKIERKYVGKEEAQIIATNIDVVFVVESVGRDYNLNRFERYFSIVRQSGIKPAVILNKIDLISKEDLADKLVQIKSRFPDVDVVVTSIAEAEGISQLKNYIEFGKTYCFLGSSGVGKSSLINKLLGNDLIKTENIGLQSARGKHITTSRQMYFLESGGIVIDNPGMREIGMADAGEGVNISFDEIIELSTKCKFNDCAHIHEAGCQVLSAVKAGEIDKDKYLNYINLKKEAEHYEMSQIEKREKERQFGKFIKNAKKEVKKYKH